MTSSKRFRILTPDGLLSRDTFVLAHEQPRIIKPDCILVVDERTGEWLTVHNTRLFPAEATDSVAVIEQRRSACLKCGRVVGVVEDQVSCPEHGSNACGLMEPSQ